MLLTIDVGNTNTVFALLDSNTIVEKWRMSTRDQRTVEEYMVWISNLMNLHGHKPSTVTGAVLASVVPQVVRPLTELCTKYFHCKPLVIGDPDVDLGIDVRVNTPREVGADRLVNAVAAGNNIKKPIIIIDFGTATTFDIVHVDGAYLGGLICPGINLSLAALHQAAAKLPRIAVIKPQSNQITGKSTEEAMQNGVYWGYLSMIEGLVDRLKAEHGPNTRVLATGGLASIFAEHTDKIDQVVPDLTLQGLRMIYNLNLSKAT